MAATLLTTGLLCVIAALVGGGIEVLGGKVPVIQSSKRQTALGLFGIILLLAAYVASLSGVSSGVAPKDRFSSDPKRDRPSEQMQLGSPLLNLRGTTWEGTLIFKNGLRMPLQIAFGHDDTALASRGPGLSLTDHCAVAAPNNETIKLDCAYSTAGDAYHTTTFHLARVYVFSVKGSFISGSTDEPSDPDQHSSVSLIKRE